MDAAPVIGDQADADSKPDQVHDPFPAELMPPNCRRASEIAEVTYNIVMDLRTWFVRTDDEGGVADIGPSEAISFGIRTVGGNREKDVFAVEQEAVPKFGGRFASRNHYINGPVTEL
ncbi:hypothetical protein GCM10017621_12590 [Maricaulis virginensis]|uniref:Uncharacterized protein n=1 Tax=Maricaulis virginensis TaxID=144022 RepID=A0A9W6IK20_9PROT|nr:hypothetical protein GCM10017621_12590 [Maricaulis virginensis]